MAQNKFRLAPLGDSHGMSGHALTELRSKAREAILHGDDHGHEWPEGSSYHQRCALVGIPTKRNGLAVDKQPTKPNVAAWKAITGWVEPHAEVFAEDAKVFVVVGGELEIATVLHTKADGTVAVEFDDASIGSFEPTKLKPVIQVAQEQAAQFIADDEPEEEPQPEELPDFTVLNKAHLTAAEKVIAKLAHPERKSLGRSDGIELLMGLGRTHDDASQFMTAAMHKGAPK